MRQKFDLMRQKFALMRQKFDFDEKQLGPRFVPRDFMRQK